MAKFQTDSLFEVTMLLGMRLEVEYNQAINGMLDQVPESIWLDKSKTFLDPCMAGGQFIKVIVDRLRYKYLCC